MFEYVLHRVKFIRGKAYEDDEFEPIAYDSLDAALIGQGFNEVSDSINNIKNRHYYVEHRIKLDYEV